MHTDGTSVHSSYSLTRPPGAEEGFGDEDGDEDAISGTVDCGTTKTLLFVSTKAFTAYVFSCIAGIRVCGIFIGKALPCVSHRRISGLIFCSCDSSSPRGETQKHVYGKPIYLNVVIYFQSDMGCIRAGLVITSLLFDTLGAEMQKHAAQVTS